MTQTPKNPFVLPGLGQSPELAGNPIMASMEMMRQAWSSLAGAGGLAQSMPITPPLSLEDLERRISDLRTVENWLQLNLSLLGSTIQGLEVQRATISTLRAFADGMSASPSSNGEGSPLDVLLGIRRSAEGASPWQAGKPAAPKPAAAQAAAAQPEPPVADKAPEAAQPRAAESLEAAAAEATPAAANAWWNLLQQQFDTLAQATAASMPGMGAAAAKTAAKPAGQSARAPAAKTAAKSTTKSAAAPRKRATKAAAKPSSTSTTKPAAKRAPRKTVAGS